MGLQAIVVIAIFSASCSISKNPVKMKQHDDMDKQIRVNAEPDTVGKIARIEFDSSSYHFGKIRQGELLHREINFTNQGPGDLMIELISACECTTLDWSRLPVKPGRRSGIKIIYNSKDKEGPQIVDIDITANTHPESTFIKFYVFVEK